MAKWEYQAFSRTGGGWSDNKYDGRSPQEKLTDLGRDGWELVSAFYDGSGYHFYLKRSISENAKPSTKKSASK